MRVVVLPSPFLGRYAYEPLAEALAARAGSVIVADASDPSGGPELVARWSADPRVVGVDLVVAHSNAGYLAPSVRAAIAPAAPIVFVDAALPHAYRPTPLAPGAFRDLLADRADADGVLPPWTRWWSREEFVDLLPREAFDALDATCPRVRLSYLDSEVTPPAGWASGPDAYLAFGSETYAEELALARSANWPVRVVDGAAHLHTLVDPGRVADAILELAGQCATGQPPPVRRRTDSA